MMFMEVGGETFMIYEWCLVARGEPLHCLLRVIMPLLLRHFECTGVGNCLLIILTKVLYGLKLRIYERKPAL